MVYEKLTPLVSMRLRPRGAGLGWAAVQKLPPSPTPLLSELCRGLPCKFPPCGLHLHDSWCPEGHDSSVANYRKQESLDSQALDLPIHDFRILPRKGIF